MRVEVRPMTSTVYIADDGREFKTETECRMHEEQDYVMSMYDYIDRNAVVNYYSDDRYGVSGFIGCDGLCGSLIKVDDTILEWAEWLEANGYTKGWMRDVKEHKDEYVFLVYPEDRYDLGSWSFDSTLDEVCLQMMEAAADLRRLVDMAKRGEKV